MLDDMSLCDKPNKRNERNELNEPYKLNKPKENS